MSGFNPHPRTNKGDKMILIKKYDNRKLYDTSLSAYTTYKELLNYVLKDVKFRVIHHKTKGDITQETLKFLMLSFLLKLNVSKETLVGTIKKLNDKQPYTHADFNNFINSLIVSYKTKELESTYVTEKINEVLNSDNFYEEKGNFYEKSGIEKLPMGEL